MKKIKKTTSTISAFCSALLLCAGCYAANVDKEAMAVECSALGKSLLQLSKANKDEICHYDVNNAGLIIANTAELLRGGRLEQAKFNLSYAGDSLRQVSQNRNDCVYFSLMVTPYADRVVFLARELQRGRE